MNRSCVPSGARWMHNGFFCELSHIAVPLQEQLFRKQRFRLRLAHDESGEIHAKSPIQASGTSTAKWQRVALNASQKQKDQKNQTMKHNKTMSASLLSAMMAVLVTLGVSFTPLPVAAGEWTQDGNVVTYTDQVGWTTDGTAYSGTVSLRMESVTLGGQFKIITTILAIKPEPGFSYSLKKSGGVNGVVEIDFASATCQSKFSFLYKPGLTRIDSGWMRCR